MFRNAKTSHNKPWCSSDQPLFGTFAIQQYLMANSGFLGGPKTEMNYPRSFRPSENFERGVERIDSGKRMTFYEGFINMIVVGNLNDFFFFRL